MTNREEQLLSWIEENPMISQKELAEKAGITRSSVAVHISNLMKKNRLLGKGYVVNRAPSVTIVGGVNIDIGGQPETTLVDKDSNPGKVTLSPGGVGRNIAHNLSLLGVKVSLITAFGQDSHAQTIKESCRNLGIDFSSSIEVKEARTSTYLFINDKDGDMKIAVNDMAIYNHLTPEFLKTKLDRINRSNMCVIDANIPKESIEWLCANCTVPIVAEPVSTHKADKFKTVLGNLCAITPNKLEASYFSGINITSEESLKKAALFFIDSGMEKVFISCGKDGIYCAEKSQTLSIKAFTTNLVNTTGAGDTQTAGLIWAMLKDMDLKNCAKAGLAAASLCIESNKAINDTLCEGVVYERMQKIS